MNEVDDRFVVALGTVAMLLFFAAATVAFDLLGAVFGGLAAMSWGAFVLGPVLRDL